MIGIHAAFDEQASVTLCVLKIGWAGFNGSVLCSNSVVCAKSVVRKVGLMVSVSAVGSVSFSDETAVTHGVSDVQSASVAAACTSVPGSTTLSLIHI